MEYKGVIAIILNEKNEVVLGKKIIKPGHFLSDSWHLPGGKVEPGEEADIAIVREMREELGIDIRVKSHLCDFFIESNGQVYPSKCLICEMVDPNAKLNPGDDLQDAGFFDFKTVREIHNKVTVGEWPIELKEFFKIKN